MRTESRRAGALIVGGVQGGLAVARSLGRRGIPVFFLTHDHQLARYSRYVEASATWAGPDRPEAAAELVAFGRTHNLEGYLLIACGDAEVRLVAQQRAMLASFFTLQTPDWECARWALDKRLTYERAAEIGVDHPWSLYPRSVADVANADIRFPVILKPSVRFESNAFTLAKAWRIDDRETLLARCAQAFALAGEGGVVLQEMIPGDGRAQFSYAALWDKGRPVAALTARRTRQYPVDFGYSSTLVETIECKEVEQAAERFLRSLGYSGLVEVEFKYDERDKRYKLLDVNIRAWTWISLGALAGVDFPHLLWQVAKGETVGPVRGRAGVTWMYFSRDLIAAAIHIAAGRLTLADYLKSFGSPITFAVFAADDPLPAIVELPLVGWRFLTRRLPLALRLPALFSHGRKVAPAVRR